MPLKGLTAWSRMFHIEVLILKRPIGAVYRKDAGAIVIKEIATCIQQ